MKRVLVLAALLAACDAGPPPATEKMTIALPAVPHAALLHVAAENGYFAAEGLAVTLVAVSHGRAGLAQLGEGKADVAAAADVPFTIAVLKGEPLALIASVLSVSNDNRIVARRDRGIGVPRELSGKTVGASFGTSGEYFLWAFLVRHKISPDTVRVVDLAPGAVAPALAEGRVDAAATWPPIVFEGVSALGDNAVLFSDTIAYIGTFSVIARREYLKAHPRAAEKLVRALLRAEQFAAARPEAALRLVAARLKVEAEALRPSWSNFGFKVELGQAQLITMEDQARWAMARGYVAPAPVTNFLPHFHLDALLAARPERVTVVR